MSRTKWFDLFDPEDRGEAFRALWGIVHYQMRSEQAGPPRPGFNRQSSHGIMAFSKAKKNAADQNLDLVSASVMLDTHDRGLTRHRHTREVTRFRDTTRGCG